jgi:hypothetical protein
MLKPPGSIVHSIFSIHPKRRRKCISAAYSKLKYRQSADSWVVGGQLKRSKKVLAVRGLNINHNHDLKNIFKGAATRAASTAGPGVHPANLAVRKMAR